MSRRSNLRQRPRVSYYEPEEPNLDEYVFCDKCNDYVYEYCSIHGPLLVIPDDKVPSKPKFPPYVPRAALTIPHVFLHLAPSIIPGAGIGVFSTLTLPRGVRFGPYRGLRSLTLETNYCWEIKDKNNKRSHVVDATDGARSNWMRYVNCSRHWSEQNLIAYQYQGQLYYRTIKIIPRFTELMVFYGSQFANLLGIDLRLYNAPKGYAPKFGARAKKPKFVVPKLKNGEVHVNGREPGTQTAETVDDAQIVNVVENKEDPKNTTTKEKVNPVPKKRKINTLKKKTTKIRNTRKDGKSTNMQQPTIDTNKRLVSNSIITENITPSIDSNTISYNGTENQNIVLNKLKTIYTCDLCNTTFNNKTSLVAHIKSHNVERRYKCNVCYCSFNQLSHLKTHIRIHTGEMPYTCNVCNKSFNESGTLKRHIRIHTGEKPYTCNVCNKRFNQACDLKKHIRIHTGEKPYTCNVCNKSFSYSMVLKTHIRTHTGEKPYTCNVCNKSFNQSISLKTHIRIHTGEKPYTCNVCNKSFNQSISLKTHIRTHTGEKPYTCNVCNKSFNQSISLKTHIRIHTGEKPYTCDICNKSFSQSSNLRSHIRIHAGVNRSRK